MSYGILGKTKPRETRGTFEKAFIRKGQAAWDARWHLLSPQARLAFLSVVKGPTNSEEKSTSLQPSVSADLFEPDILKELVSAGFVEVVSSRGKTKSSRVSAVAGLYHFATRVRAMHRFRLLDPSRPPNLVPYVNFTAFQIQIPHRCAEVLHAGGVETSLLLGEVVNRYVIRHRWPGWAALLLKSKVAEQVVDAIRKADGPIPLVDLPTRITKGNAEEVRAAVDALISRLALFEDLDPVTLDVMIDILPAVREDFQRASLPRQRPALEVCESPREVGPSGGILVDDLRAFLLEVAGEPPRLRQDGEIFAKAAVRFQEAMSPLSAPIAEVFGLDAEDRVFQTYDWALLLNLVKQQKEEKASILRLTTKGDKWLTAPIEEQYASVIDQLRVPISQRDYNSAASYFLVRDLDNSGYVDNGDIRFLGSEIFSVKHRKGKVTPYWDLKVEDRHALRESLYNALCVLPVGVFHPLDNALAHVVFGRHNPLLLQVGHDEVSVYRMTRPVPPFEEDREFAASDLLKAMLRSRLIVVGAFQVAIDDESRLCVSRTPLLDVYFGRKVPSLGLAGGAGGESRVVIQPDFSVIIIGLNPAPAAALAPFCERTKGGGSQGAMIFKITRESVVKAVAYGLKPAEIVDRLQKHASIEIPSNVLKEVRNWAGWVRHVIPSTITVLRCPDRDTADRVVSALKRQAERITDLLVSIDKTKLTLVERNKLREQGIIVAPGDSASRAVVPKKKRDDD